MLFLIIYFVCLVVFSFVLVLEVVFNTGGFDYWYSKPKPRFVWGFMFIFCWLSLAPMYLFKYRIGNCVKCNKFINWLMEEV